MSNIKVGQVYSNKSMNFRIVSTWVDEDRDMRDFIRNDGFVLSGCLNEDYELIAEYPTWQEAVNSKEFNDES